MDLLSSSEEEGVPMFVSNVLKIRPAFPQSAFNIKDFRGSCLRDRGCIAGAEDVGQRRVRRQDHNVQQTILILAD